MRKMLVAGVTFFVFLSNGQSEEVYDLKSFMQVYECPEGTPADECEPVAKSRVPVDFSVTLVDQGSNDPKIFLGTANANVVRDGISYALEVSVAKFMYSSEPADIGYEVRANFTPEGESKRKVVLNYHNMSEFNTRADLYSDLYKRGTTKYSPVFMTMPEGLTLKDQLRKPILAEIIASE